ncbi:hypothetical protein RvY_00043 [Ramazzottius varieornatus]|uniref:Uncharacterized protein n=1 Tax=Ramazzottius varieornatus TaxID=947166 RepID=A0A1D1UF33_RAMVA|nr:hypothetical protein RvY_00043 [Ramazzottius varieornatus]
MESGIEVEFAVRRNDTATAWRHPLRSFANTTAPIYKPYQNFRLDISAKNSSDARPAGAEAH